MVDFIELKEQAETDGRQCVVGALILDERGRAFVHRRGWDRRFLPGCWDIVGGHVDAGETLVAALGREVAEETGWRLRGSPQLIHVVDWETEGAVGPHRRREFDFLVEVEGDLRRPRLERPKHVEFRWVGVGETRILDENRGKDLGLVRRLVELALESAQRPTLTYPHASIFVDTTMAAPLEALRARWDPAMAAQIAAHVTVAYPGELSGLDELLESLSRAAPQVPPFRLRLGEVSHPGTAEAGVFVEVADVDGGWLQLRQLIGVATGGARPHATLVHPRTTNRGPQAWEALRGRAFALDFAVNKVAAIAFDGRMWSTVASFALRG